MFFLILAFISDFHKFREGLIYERSLDMNRKTYIDRS